MVINHFIAREQELAQLDAYLNQVMGGQGLVCFVKGQAGSGKTSLVTEFASRAQNQYKELAVAFGQSDAQTGLGDPHLPFREILRQLTGDVDEVLTSGTITKENANRLQKILLISGQALVEVGPDLIGLFVPGVGLATRLGAFAAEKVGWLEKLEHLVRKPAQDISPSELGIQQSHIYEQYANVLRKLSERQPLILILDDLQWADASSVGLLFHLGRRIEGYRIFIVGTYRPEEVTIGRAGDRHPLEKVLTEFKRYFGDISIDLDRAIEVEGERFVNAFLDTESNVLSHTFRKKLYEHTDGHPLFTIELLRNMQERGDLVQDTEGHWVETIHLDWESLPERVEGVIEERISRLGGELRQILTIGCVEGENFTAEVIARVQAAEARGLIQRLSGELERQHRLVSSRGIRKLDPTGQRLSLYRFQHNLFQWYLYHELSESERAYLHEDVGKSLETLYGEQVGEIVVQLARHFEEAGLSQKARLYLAQAGKQAADRFANDDAIGYFNRALELTPEENMEERYSLLYARERIHGLQGAREDQIKDLENLQEISKELRDNKKIAEVSIRMASYFNAISDYPSALSAAQEAIRLAEMSQNTETQAIGHCYLGTTMWHQGEYSTAVDQLELGMRLSRVAGLRSFEASSLRNLGAINIVQGDYDKAKIHLEEALRISREEGNRRGEAKTLTNLGALFYERNDLTRTKAIFEEVLSIFCETGDRRNEANLLGNMGVICESQGNFQAAINYYEKARNSIHQIGDRENEALQLSNLGSIHAKLGDYPAAKDFYEQALQIVHEIHNQRIEIFILNGLGLTLVMMGDFINSKTFCENSLRLTQELNNQIEEVVALNILGFTYDCLGNYSSAHDYYDDSYQIAKSISFRKGESQVLSRFGLLYHHMGEDTTAQEYCHQALEINQELDDPTSQATALTVLGYSLLGSGMQSEAGECFQKVENLRGSLGQHHLSMEAVAGLAQVYLTQENHIEAQVKVIEILEQLKTCSINGTLEPFGIYLTCYQVLKINSDPRAEEILETAHTMLQDRASRIDSLDLQRSFLENVPVNREIAREYSNLGDRIN